MRKILLQYIVFFSIALAVSSFVSSTAYARTIDLPLTTNAPSNVCGGNDLFEYIRCLFFDKMLVPPVVPESRPERSSAPAPDQLPIESRLECSFYPEYTECQSFNSVEPTSVQEKPTPEEPSPLKCQIISDQIYECTSYAEDPVLLPTSVRALPSPINSQGCARGGCSGQLCEDMNGERRPTTCEWREQYGCYQEAICERQANGACGFTETDQLQMCLQRYQ